MALSKKVGKKTQKFEINGTSLHVWYTNFCGNKQVWYMSQPISPETSMWENQLFISLDENIFELLWWWSHWEGFVLNFAHW